MKIDIPLETVNAQSVAAEATGWLTGSWWHSVIVIVAVLYVWGFRETRRNAEWAENTPLSDDLGTATPLVAAMFLASPIWLVLTRVARLSDWVIRKLLLPDSPRKDQRQ